MPRFAAKLMFQWRVIRPTQKRRLCEDRIICFDSRNTKSALTHARNYGRSANYRYTNANNEEVAFEFIGIMDLLELGAECGPQEVWYDIRERLQPMESKAKWIPTDEEFLQESQPKKVRVRRG